MTVLPVLIVVLPLLAAAAALAARGAAWGTRVSLTGHAVSAVGALVLAGSVLAGGPIVAAGGWLRADALAALLVVLVSVMALMSAWYGHDYMALVRTSEPHDARWEEGRYEALVHGLVATLLLAALTDDLALMWIALEGATLCSALLVGYYRRPGALEAAWKYLILGSVGIALALFATVLLHHAGARVMGEGGESLRWSLLMGHAGALDQRFVRLAFLFALVGYGAKAGLAPMHNWIPDAYSQAPAPAAALLATALSAVTLSALLRFHAVAVASVGLAWSSGLLALFGALSMIVAVPFLLVQGEFKRLLAWSSLEHLGFVTLAIGFGSPLAVFAGLLHLLLQSFAKGLAFLVAGSLLRATGSRRMDHASGVLAASPRLGVMLLVAALGLTGLPPAATFVSEWLALAGGFATGRSAAAIVALVALVLAFLGVTFHVSLMLLGTPREGFADPLPRRTYAPLAVLAGLTLVLGLWLPSPLRALVEQASRVLLP